MHRRESLTYLLSLFSMAALAPAMASEAIRLVTINNVTSRVNALVLKDVYRRLGIELQILAMPPSRVTAMATQGLADGEVNRILAYGDAHPTLIRIEPALNVWTVSAFYKVGSGPAPRSPADLAGRDVGIVRGIKATADMSSASHVSVAPSSRELMLMLNGNRFEIALDGTPESEFYIRRLGLQGIASIELNRYPLYHYLHEKHRNLVPVVAREIKKLADSGELKSLFDAASATLRDSGEEP
ncbi:MAG: hypothetical protein V4463_00825 [Pseudomonadota bacterium]